MNVTAEEATDALWRHSCRFGTPLEIMTDCGSQFMNATLEGYATLSGLRHPVYYTILKGGKRDSRKVEQGSQSPHSEHLTLS